MILTARGGGGKGTLSGVRPPDKLHSISIYSIPFHSLARYTRYGDPITDIFHLVSFSAALYVLAKFIPVYPIIVFFSAPLVCPFFFPDCFLLLCPAESLLSQKTLMWPNQTSFRFFTMTVWCFLGNLTEPIRSRLNKMSVRE